MIKYKLDNVIREFYAESLGASDVDNRYPMFLMTAISGLRQMNQDISGNYKFTTLTLNDNFTADLPEDYLDYKGLYICRNGQLLSLGLNQNMCPAQFDDCGNLSIPQVTRINENDVAFGTFNYGYNYFYSYNQDFQFVGKKFGYRGGNNILGTYRFFEDKGYVAIQLGIREQQPNISETQDLSNVQLVLEYLAEPLEADGEYQVHPYDVEAVKAWIWWKYVQRKRSYDPRTKQLAERDYNTAKKEARKKHNAFNITEVVGAVRSGYLTAPKI